MASGGFGAEVLATGHTRLPDHSPEPGSSGGKGSDSRHDLRLDGGRLPAPVVDAPPAWRRTVAASLQSGADRYVRGSDRVLTVQQAIEAGDDRSFDEFLAGYFARSL